MQCSDYSIINVSARRHIVIMGHFVTISCTIATLLLWLAPEASTVRRSELQVACNETLSARHSAKSMSWPDHDLQAHCRSCNQYSPTRANIIDRAYQARLPPCCALESQKAEIASVHHLPIISRLGCAGPMPTTHIQSNMSHSPRSQTLLATSQDSARKTQQTRP